jgi:hypothetical protein
MATIHDELADLAKKLKPAINATKYAADMADQYGSPSAVEHWKKRAAERDAMYRRMYALLGQVIKQQDEEKENTDAGNEAE